MDHVSFLGVLGNVFFIIIVFYFIYKVIQYIRLK